MLENHNPLGTFTKRNKILHQIPVLWLPDLSGITSSKGLRKCQYYRMTAAAGIIMEVCHLKARWQYFLKDGHANTAGSSE